MKTKPDIHCAYDELRAPGDLVENPRNPNTHSKEQIKMLANIIHGQGWRSPITVSKRSGFITKGHCRLAAALVLDCKQVPVDLQDYDSEAAEWADMIADNRIAELAEISLPDLKDLLIEIDAGDFDMTLTGFDAKGLEGLMTAFQPDEGDGEDGGESGEGSEKGKLVKCPKCSAVFNAKENRVKE